MIMDNQKVESGVLDILALAYTPRTNKYGKEGYCLSPLFDAVVLGMTVFLGIAYFVT
jgi:hypothetical protein